MMRPCPRERVSPLARASENSSARVKTRSISGRVRSSIETTSVLESRAIKVRLELLSLPDHHRIGPIHLGQAHVDALAVGSLDVFADVVGANGQFALAAIDEHG